MGNNDARVWANGCFDVFHFGHANFLRQAKVMGSYLIAGVHGDSDIARNKASPVMGERERAKIISAVKWVDEVRTGVPYGDVLKTLDENACQFCVHGDDIAQDANGRDIYAECKEKGRFCECKRTEGISTTLIIDRILLADAGGHKELTHWPHVGGPLSQISEIENEPEDAQKKNEESEILKENDSNGFVQRRLEMPVEYYREKVDEFSSKSRTPERNMKVIYAQGVFDLFHSGHVDFLEKCKASVEDGFLVVGVLTDEEISRVYGGYPVTNTYERVLALLSCKFVDQVEIGVPYEITSQFLEDMKIEYVFHGMLWELPSDPYKAVRDKNIFYQVDSGNDLTTSAIIERIINSREMYRERNSKKSESQFSRVRLQGNKP
ncbi:ethanolamine-phosphate cytidylyltransferase-like isoform X2 [Dendronephthya gigantea]|uniref:ethanolamine-phosphate cytidylyltransferase-like isoform X2 n=1 Tax=Dendronephthya gigantea TaxID=151771 RepID=UPI00106DC53D|nr:ethanolamine-phosphate cytidylyltransferase-like isoform X2 [Dendronephthya gigantea]